MMKARFLIPLWLVDCGLIPVPLTSLLAVIHAPSCFYCITTETGQMYGDSDMYM